MSECIYIYTYIYIYIYIYKSECIYIYIYIYIRSERCIYRASCPSQGTVNGGAVSKWPRCRWDVKHNQPTINARGGGVQGKAHTRLRPNTWLIYTSFHNCPVVTLIITCWNDVMWWTRFRNKSQPNHTIFRNNPKWIYLQMLFMNIWS